MINDKNVVIFDTSTLISAFIFKNSIPRQAVDKALASHTIIISEEIERELLEVITRKKFNRYLSLTDRIDMATDFLLRTQTISEIEAVEHYCRDPKDVPFLALAYTEKADIIVSSDQDLLVLNPFYQTKIIKPAEFVQNH
jgi:putative PIN family toxin of toxin-antitoxin system